MHNYDTVVILTDSSEVDGGVSVVAINSALGLADRGLEIVYFSSTGVIDNRLKTHPRITVIALGKKNILVNPSRIKAAIQGIYDLDVKRALESLIDTLDLKRTIFHLHSWTKSLSLSVPHILQKKGGRLVTTLHEYFLACPSGSFYNYKYEKTCEFRGLDFKCITCNCDPRSALHKQWRLLRTLTQNQLFGISRKMDNIICVSPGSRDILNDYLPATCKVNVLRNPIDIVRSDRSKAELNKDLIYVGRLSKEKGVLELAKALQKDGLKAIFVGDGYLRPELEKMLPNSKFVGMVSPSEVVKLMRESRCLVFPSKWLETQGMVVFEAVAIGLPVMLSTSCVAAGDLNRDLSFHFDIHSQESISSTLQKVVNSDYIRNVSEKAYEWYWKNPWSKQSHVNGLMKIYENL